jgi:hypothetical protein
VSLSDCLEKCLGNFARGRQLYPLPLYFTSLLRFELEIGGTKGMKLLVVDGNPGSNRNASP